MASKKGLVKYGAYVERVVGPEAAWRTVTSEITFMLPPEAEHTDLVWKTAQDRAGKRWAQGRWWVVEAWRY